jgi:nucleoid DNA-binding protein
VAAVYNRGGSMTKRDLVIRIAEETKLTQQEVFAVLQKTLDYIVEALKKGETVEFRNFGVFMVQERKPRIGRNPNRPEQVVTIPSRKVVKFKQGRIMRRDITQR